MSLLAVIPGLAPGLLALLPQILLLLFALVVLLLSPRTWWRTLVYSCRRPQWILALLLGAGACWLGISKISSSWPAPAAGEVRKPHVGDFTAGDSRYSFLRPGLQGPAIGVEVEALSVEGPQGARELLSPGRIFRVSETGAISCVPFSGSEAAWEIPSPGAAGLLFPLVGVGRNAAGRDLPDCLLALSTAGAGTRARVIDADRGTILSTVLLEDRAVLPPVVVDELAVVTCRDSVVAFSLAGLPREGHSIEWKAPLPAGGVAALSGDEDGHVFLLGDHLSALDIVTGEPVADLPLGEQGSGVGRRGIRTHQGLVYLLQEGAGIKARGRIFCFGLLGSSFEKSWELELPGLEAAGVALFGGKLGCLSRPGGELVLLDAATGQRLGGKTYSPAIPLGLAADLSACYVVLSGGKVSRFSHIRQREDWRLGPGADWVASQPGTGAPLLRSGRLYLRGEGHVFVLAESGEEEGPAGWVSARADGGRSGNSDRRRGPLAAEVLWRVKLPGGAAGSDSRELDPVIPLGEKLICWGENDGGGKIFSLGRNGKPLDSMDLAARPVSAVSNGARLFILSGEAAASRGPARLSSLEIPGVKIRQAWERELPGPGRGRLCMSGGGIVVPGADSILLVDAADGKTTWERRDLGQAKAVHPLGRDLLVVHGESLLLVDSSSGQTLRNFPGPAGELLSIASVGRRLFLASKRNRASRLDAFLSDTGGLLWSRRLGEDLQVELASMEDCLVVADTAELVSFGPGKGEQLQEFSPGTKWNAVPALAMGMMVAIDGGRLVALDPVLGGEIWSLELGDADPFSSVSIIAGRVYLRSAGELLCAGQEEAP
ncbi:MAG: PQQ-binding-like beta-propeller repeat protein [Planctomycetota bacterium]